MAASPLTLLPTYRGAPWRRGPRLDRHIGDRGQRPPQLHDPVGQQIVGVLHRPAAQDAGGVQGHPHAAPLQVPGLPRQPQTPLAHPPHSVVQDQLRTEQLQRALGKGPLLNLNPQGHLLPDVEVGFRLGLGVAGLVVGLQQQGGRQQAGRHAAAAVVQAVPRGEIGIAKQAAPQRGKCPVERLPVHQVQIQLVGFPQAPLAGPFPQHRVAPVPKLGGPGV